MLPEYALASTVGSHCPSSVLLYAQRNSLQPKLAKALEAVAKLNRMQEVMPPTSRPVVSLALDVSGATRGLEAGRP